MTDINTPIDDKKVNESDEINDTASKDEPPLNLYNVSKEDSNEAKDITDDRQTESKGLDIEVSTTAENIGPIQANSQNSSINTETDIIEVNDQNVNINNDELSKNVFSNKITVEQEYKNAKEKENNETVSQNYKINNEQVNGMQVEQESKNATEYNEKNLQDNKKLRPEHMDVDPECYISIEVDRFKRKEEEKPSDSVNNDNLNKNVNANKKDMDQDSNNITEINNHEIAEGGNNKQNYQNGNTNNDQQNKNTNSMQIDDNQVSSNAKEVENHEIGKGGNNKENYQNDNSKNSQLHQNVNSMQIDVDEVSSNATQVENHEIDKREKDKVRATNEPKANLNNDQQNKNVNLMPIDVDPVLINITDEGKIIEESSQSENKNNDNQNKNVIAIEMDVDESNNETEGDKGSQDENINNETDITTINHKFKETKAKEIENPKENDNENIKNAENNNTAVIDITSTNSDNLATETPNTNCANLTETIDLTDENNELADMIMKGLEKDNIVKIEVPIKNENEIENVQEDFEYPNVIILGSVAPKEKKEAEKNKRRICKREIRSLGTVIDEEESNEFDTFVGTNERLFKKYKLRDSRRPDYRIPTEIPTQESSKSEENERQPRAIISKASEKTEKVIREFPCTYCGLVFYVLGNLSKHLHTVHGRVFTCSLCSKNFESNSKLVAHKTSHDYEDYSFVCTECKLAFSSQYDYLVHELTHSSNSEHKCVECNLIFKEDYAKHLATHFKPFISCNICSTVVQGKVNLQKHLKIHTNIERGFQCVECLKVLSDKTKYESHMALHTGVKTHQCLYCGKAFRTSNQQIVHTRIHLNLRPYPCKLCDSTFKQSVDLLRHMVRKHKEGLVNKFECDVCDKIYVLKTDLEMHKRIHKEERMFPCPECDAKFFTMGGLKGHVMFKHTKSRPVECKLCNKSFINKNKYQAHAKSKAHKNNVYKFSLKNEE